MLIPEPADAATYGGSYPWRFAILGDSYASGEGVNPAGSGGYYPDSDTPSNSCHRSSLAYGPRVAEQLTAVDSDTATRLAGVDGYLLSRIPRTVG